jgi:hypothetical protein
MKDNLNAFRRPVTQYCIPVQCQRKRIEGTFSTDLKPWSGGYEGKNGLKDLMPLICQ